MKLKDEKKRSFEESFSIFLLILRIFVWNERLELVVVLFGVDDAAGEENRSELQKTSWRKRDRENVDVICDFVFKLNSILKRYF